MDRQAFPIEPNLHVANRAAKDSNQLGGLNNVHAQRLSGHDADNLREDADGRHKRLY